MSDLLKRLTELGRPDREVDGLIAKRFRQMPEEAKWQAENIWGQETNQWVSGGWGAYEFHEPEHYTASLDATVELVERKLPGWVWDVSAGDDHGPFAFVHRKEDKSPTGSMAATPAIALLIALLKALEDRDV